MEAVKKFDKATLVGIAAAVLFTVCAGWILTRGVPASAVKVLDSRVTFKFTAYPNKDEVFASCSLENTKNYRVKALVFVDLKNGPGGAVLKSVKETAEFGPQEIKTIVTKFELPKAKEPRLEEVAVKVRRANRA